MKKKKGNKDHIKILRYFYNIKIWLGVLAILMLLLAVVNVFNPIVSAKLLTSITELNIKGAFIFSILFLIVSLASIIINELTNVVYLKKLKNMIIYNIRKDMVKNIFEMKTINFDKHTSGELLECFQWNSNYDIEEVKSELADVINYALLLADKLGVNPKKIVLDKMEITAKKYPIEKAKGVSTKYTKLK